MRLVVVLGVAILASGCMARIGEDPMGGTEPDARVAPQPIDGGTSGSDGGSSNTDASMAYLQACMAKGYTAAAGLPSLYRVVNSAATWTAAATACNTDVAGATHLVVLSSTAEVTFVKSTRLGWVGLSDQATENTFVNVTNEPADQRPFSSGQPDNGSGTEDCVQIKSDGLDDDQCNNEHQYLCECDGRPAI